MATKNTQPKADEKAARALALTTKLGNPVITAEESARIILEQRAVALHARAVELSGLIPSEFDGLSDEERSAFVDAAAEALDAEQGDMPKLGATPKGDLIRVAKGGDVLDINPIALGQHRELGWKQIDV